MLKPKALPFRPYWLLPFQHSDSYLQWKCDCNRLKPSYSRQVRKRLMTEKSDKRVVLAWMWLGFSLFFSFLFFFLSSPLPFPLFSSLSPLLFVCLSSPLLPSWTKCRRKSYRIKPPLLIWQKSSCFLQTFHYLLKLLIIMILHTCVLGSWSKLCHSMK